MEMRPAWREMSRRPRIMLDTETIVDNPASIYNAVTVEVGERDISDVRQGIDLIFDRAESQEMDAAQLDEYLMAELPKVCDATAEDVDGIITDARFLDTDRSSKTLAERMRDATLEQFTKPEYTVDLVDGDGETIGRAATIKNVSDEDLATAVRNTLHAFGYEMDDDERGTLKRIDPWDFSTVEQAIEQYPVAVEGITLDRDRELQMGAMRDEAYKSTSIEAVMMAGGRLDAYGEYGLDGGRVGAITTFDHASNLPRHVGDGMVIGFDKPMLTTRIVDAVDEGPGSGQRIQATLEANGASGVFTDTRVEIDDASVEDPWAGRDVEETTTEVNPWQNVQETPSMAMGPEIE